MRRATLAACCLVVLAQPALAAAGSEGGSREARTDQQPSGNRVVPGETALRRASHDLALPGVATWVLADPAAPGERWLVVDATGSVWRVGTEAAELVASLPPGVAPLARLAADGTLVVLEAGGDRAGFREPLPDTRVVRAGLGSAALVGPTDRYAHGVLGDDVEASAVETVGDAGDRVRIEIETDVVVEGISPLLADVTGDGQAEILVTVSDEESGARLRLYDQAGGVVAESEPIGQGYRWLHQLGVGATGPDGETEIISVRTPHIGGVVEAHQLRDGRLERVATQPGYSSHLIGSRNLDMALLADTDADGRSEVVVPTQDMTALGVLTRTGDGFRLLDTLPLDGRLASNLAAAVDADGQLHLAVGTSDGRVRVFG